MVYASTSPALAILEALVNVEIEDAPDDLALIEVHIPGTLTAIADADLPNDWNATPPSASTQLYGSRWAASKRSLTLAVPSVVLPIRAEMNVLLNPLHRFMRRVRVANTLPYSLDRRLLHGDPSHG